jgi:hypothetical protein
MGHLVPEPNFAGHSDKQGPYIYIYILIFKPLKIPIQEHTLFQSYHPADKTETSITNSQL